MYTANNGRNSASRRWLIVASHDVTQETAPHIGGDDTKFVLGSDVGIKQALVAQAFDAVPAPVLELSVVTAFVLVPKQQDIEISTQQEAAHCIHILRILVLHLLFQILTHLKHSGSPR